MTASFFLLTNAMEAQPWSPSVNSPSVGFSVEMMANLREIQHQINLRFPITMLAFRLDLLSMDAISGLISSHQYEHLKFHEFLPADSLRRVFSTQYCFENRYALLSLLLVPCLLLFVTISSASKRAYKPKENAHLQALSTVVIPTRNHSQSIKYSVKWKDRQMELSLSALVEKVKAGVIELRNPREDLSDMFRERLKVHGWRIGLDIEPVWSTRTMGWLLKGHFLCSVASKGPPPLLLSENPSTLHLDAVPYSQMEASVASFIKSLTAGSTATIEFTTISPQIAWMSKEFVLCSLPWRTSTPFLVSLTSILSICAPAMIKSVVNISNKYANTLNNEVERLVEDRTKRIAFMNQYGLEIWRERRFLMYWEAGLLDAGHVTRWMVELQQ
ncbi:hypothetical protein EV421DRAFT_1904458 [Armillaria borealis]|uniref:Uncharacterized protein n=1 Tax=Armillaria borealis TaxID=47425 RepID=A0AA39JHH4_9AGAR|nr:hypothetical protein EV421DRAFT_1904458 [Armillaria borealis]